MGNMYDQKLDDASVILVNASCVKPHVVHRLREYLTRAVPVGCVVVSIRHPVIGPGAEDFEPVAVNNGGSELALAMSWGVAPVHVAVRRRGAPTASPRVASPAQIDIEFDLDSMD